MHKVKRAIVLAAGIGKRLRPITLHTPKPLVRVNGVRIIDTVIQGLHENGIKEIYIVTGYLGEQFSVLQQEYDGITLLENQLYDRCNNISSLYFARDYLEDAIILDGDQIICNADVLSPEFERSGYNAVRRTGHTDEWLMRVKGGKVVSCSRTGGDNGWQLYSVSRWTAEDGRKLKKHLEEEFDKKGNIQIYWDDVVMFCHFRDYELGIRAMNETDIIEIDNLRELAAADKNYIPYMEKE